MKSGTPVFDELVASFSKHSAYVARLYGPSVALDTDESVLMERLPKFTEKTAYASQRLRNVQPHIPSAEEHKPSVDLPKRVPRPPTGWSGFFKTDTPPTAEDAA